MNAIAGNNINEITIYEIQTFPRAVPPKLAPNGKIAGWAAFSFNHIADRKISLRGRRTKVVKNISRLPGQQKC